MKRRLIAWGRGRPSRRLPGYAALLALGLMLACAKKDKEVICTETCCSADESRYKYVTQLKDEETAFTKGEFRLKKLLNGVYGVIVCNMSLDQVNGLIEIPVSNGKQPPIFRYQISGTVYQNLDATNINGNPVYYIKLKNVKRTM